MSSEHAPIGNQFIRLIYGVDAIAAEDNANYAKALMIIAGADGEISAGEWDWFYDRGRAMGVPKFVLDDFKNFDWRSAKLEDYVGSNHAVARILLYDAITMSAADGDYSAEEANQVRNAARLMGVSADIVDALEGIVAMEATLRGARHTLLRSSDY
jgi:tellurite resistance protein